MIVLSEINREITAPVWLDMYTQIFSRVAGQTKIQVKDGIRIQVDEYFRRRIVDEIHIQIQEHSRDVFVEE